MIWCSSQKVAVEEGIRAVFWFCLFDLLWFGCRALCVSAETFLLCWQRGDRQAGQPLFQAPCPFLEAALTPSKAPYAKAPEYVTHWTVPTSSSPAFLAVCPQDLVRLKCASLSSPSHFSLTSSAYLLQIRKDESL